jgi:hypothetical protein
MTTGRRARKRGGKGGRVSRKHETQGDPPPKTVRRSARFERDKAAILEQLNRKWGRDGQPD